MASAAPTYPCIFPCLRYDDAWAAIDWLVRAFGFEKQMVVDGPEGSVAHAQLQLGHGMIMLGSAKADAYGTSPRRLAGLHQTVYVVVPDPDAHEARARVNGAEIIRQLENTSYGSREYSCRDLEGHVWSFGTYQPFAVPG